MGGGPGASAGGWATTPGGLGASAGGWAAPPGGPGAADGGPGAANGGPGAPSDDQAAAAGELTGTGDELVASTGGLAAAGDGPGAADGWPAGTGHRAPGGDSLAWYRRGLELLSRGSPAAAAELLERAAEAEPGARSVREALARAQFDAGRYAQAADSFRRNVEAIPSDDYAHFGLGLALARGGDPAAAAEHLALAAAMRPELPHYAEALRGVRATLAARAQAASGAASPPAPGGDEPS